MSHTTPFGQAARVHILTSHLTQFGAMTPAIAWRFVYQELLWTDGSTGLAHLYESDKTQPGRSWHARTRLFTDLLCQEFGLQTALELKPRIDWLFRESVRLSLVRTRVTPEDEEIKTTFNALESNYVPDVELVLEFATILGQQLSLPPDQVQSLARQLAVQARYYFTVERKRQNILGEGFEDLLWLLLVNVAQVPTDMIRVRERAINLPGFQRAETTRERVEAPDIAVVVNGRTELLASVKWSLRHDRQKQLSDELDCYVDLLSQSTFPRYILITNEYDPGRLVNANGLNRRGQKVDCIYHINPTLLLKVLHDHERVEDLHRLVDTRRLRSLEDLLNDLRVSYG